MKKLSSMILGVITLICYINFVYSAPLMEGIALNHETKECAGYWGGDEFTQYRLPDGWKAYYPDYQKHIIETDVGNCSLKNISGWKDCCSVFGYKYVSDNIGKSGNNSFAYAIILILILVFSLIYYIKRKK